MSCIAATRYTNIQKVINFTNMKATITFSLPEEDHEYRNAIEGAKMRSILWDMDQWLRAKLKYEELTDAQYDAYKATRDELRRLLIEGNIDETQ